MSPTPTADAVESVWDYPRPPKLEPTSRSLRITHAGIVLADSTHALRVLETSHPPVYYIPQTEIRMQLLRPSLRRGSFCEFKGVAVYWNIDLSSAHRPDGTPAPEMPVIAAAGWSYPDPSGTYRALKDHLAFYASKVDECTVDGERVEAQPGDFYGGWITSHVRGPFKGAPGTLGW